MVNAKALEDAIWVDCRRYTLNPGEALAEAQKQLRDPLSQAANLST